MTEGIPYGSDWAAEDDLPDEELPLPEEPPPPEPPDERDGERHLAAVADRSADGGVLDRYAASKVDWATFWQRDRRTEDWLVEPLAPRGRQVAMYSPAGSGKSDLALYVAACLATGRRVLDQPAGEPINVLYLDLEMTEDDVHERLEDMGFGPDDDLSRLHYYLLLDLPPLDTAAGGADLRALAAELDADLVVIDTTAEVIEGPENDADTLQAYTRHTGRPLKADGRTVWRLDHAGKDLDRGQRGTSAKNDDVDVVWELRRRDGSQAQLRATKRRVSWVPEAVDLVRLEDPVRFEQALGSWPEGTKEVADLLDALDVPLDAGRRPAAQALREAGHRYRNDTVSAGVRWRRQRGDQARDHLRDHPAATERDHPRDQQPDFPSHRDGTASGTSRDHPPQPNGTTGSPPRGTGVPGRGGDRDDGEVVDDATVQRLRATAQINQRAAGHSSDDEQEQP